MRVAVLCDVHGNLPALEAVLAEVAAEAPDAIVVGGDVAPGPLVAESLERLQALGARFVMGNGDREVVEAFDSGANGPGARWTASRLEQGHRDALAAFEPVVRLDVTGLGATLFCHGSPRSDTEMITALTGEERLAPMLADVAEAVVVCGHTHRQFDLAAHGRRVLNAGSVGMPYEGEAAAFWLMLGTDAQLRRTDYDVPAALARLRASGFPDVDEAMLRDSLITPADPDEVAAFFERQAG
jgi:predicted phosphodiesterase